MRDDDHFYQFLDERYRPVNDSLVFVAMPFSRDLDVRYFKIVKPTLQSIGLEVRRADEIYGTTQLIRNVISSLQESRLVIADLTGRNPNVLYELGLANGFGKDVLLLASSEHDIPVDLRHLTCLIADDSNPESFASNLIPNVRNMLNSQPTFVPLTAVQRILTYSRYLGITDIVPASEVFAFRLMLEAQESLDMLLISGRTFSGMHARNLSAMLANKFATIPTRALLVHPTNSFCNSYYDIVDGLGEGNCAVQVEVGYRRLLGLGITPRFHMEFVPWGGVLLDRKKAVIQFVHPDDWQTYFFILEQCDGGMFDAFMRRFDNLYAGSISKDG